MAIDHITQTWLGIDFSGDHLMWRPDRKNSNIYIAEVRAAHVR